MKTFPQWLREGPLAEENLTDREITLVRIAFNEGALAVSEDAVARLGKMVDAIPRAAA